MVIQLMNLWQFARLVGSSGGQRKRLAVETRKLLEGLPVRLRKELFPRKRRVLHEHSQRIEPQRSGS
jgi:hypothetical protein